MAVGTVRIQGRGFDSLTRGSHGSIERAVGIPGIEPAHRLAPHTFSRWCLRVAPSSLSWLQSPCLSSVGECRPFFVRSDRASFPKHKVVADVQEVEGSLECVMPQGLGRALEEVRCMQLEAPGRVSINGIPPLDGEEEEERAAMQREVAMRLCTPRRPFSCSKTPLG